MRTSLRQLLDGCSVFIEYVSFLQNVLAIESD
jgi:hypothetical protein